MKKFAALVVATAVVSAAPAWAEDDDGSPQFTFGASTSFVYDGNSPNGGTAAFNALTYANQEPRDETFNIDLMQIGVSGQRGNASYKAAVDFGDLAALADNSSDSDVSLQEAWVAYDREHVGLTAGRFGTPIGYEVLEPWGNRHVSRSWGWQAQPINHDGLIGRGNADTIDVSIGVVNSFTVASNPVGVNDTNDDKGIIGSFSAAPSDALNFHFAGYVENDGAENQMVNAIVSGLLPFGEQYDLSYGVEGNWRKTKPGGGSNDFWNFTGYFGANYGPTGLDLRVDYTDDDGIVTPISTELWSLTLTGSWALVDSVDFRVEYRHDDAEDSVFGDGSGSDDTINTVQVQLVWNPEL